MKPKVKFNPVTFDYEILNLEAAQGKIFNTSKEAREFIKQNFKETAPPAQVTEVKSGESSQEGAPILQETQEAAAPQGGAKVKAGEPSPVADLFSAFSGGTEEDQGQGVQPPEERVEILEETETGENKAAEILTTQLDAEPEAQTYEERKATNSVTAMLIVELLESGVLLLCQFIAKDFSKETESRYLFSREKKKNIQTAVFRVLMLRQKKTNPYVSLTLSILIGVAPAVIIAFSERKKKAEAERKEAERAYFQQKMNSAINAGKNIQDIEPDNVYTPAAKQPQEIIKKPQVKTPVNNQGKKTKGGQGRKPAVRVKFLSEVIEGGKEFYKGETARISQTMFKKLEAEGLVIKAE